MRGFHRVSVSVIASKAQSLRGHIRVQHGKRLASLKRLSIQGHRVQARMNGRDTVFMRLKGTQVRLSPSGAQKFSSTLGVATFVPGIAMGRFQMING